MSTQKDETSPVPVASAAAISPASEHAIASSSSQPHNIVQHLSTMLANIMVTNPELMQQMMHASLHPPVLDSAPCAENDENASCAAVKEIECTDDGAHVGQPDEPCDPSTQCETTNVRFSLAHPCRRCKTLKASHSKNYICHCVHMLQSCTLDCRYECGKASDRSHLIDRYVRTADACTRRLQNGKINAYQNLKKYSHSGLTVPHNYRELVYPHPDVAETSRDILISGFPRVHLSTSSESESSSSSSSSLSTEMTHHASLYDFFKQAFAERAAVSSATTDISQAIPNVSIYMSSAEARELFKSFQERSVQNKNAKYVRDNPTDNEFDTWDNRDIHVIPSRIRFMGMTTLPAQFVPRLRTKIVPDPLDAFLKHVKRKMKTSTFTDLPDANEIKPAQFIEDVDKNGNPQNILAVYKNDSIHRAMPLYNGLATSSVETCQPDATHLHTVHIGKDDWITWENSRPCAKFTPFVTGKAAENAKSISRDGHATSEPATRESNVLISSTQVLENGTRLPVASRMVRSPFISIVDEPTNDVTFFKSTLKPCIRDMILKWQAVDFKEMVKEIEEIANAEHKARIDGSECKYMRISFESVPTATKQKSDASLSSSAAAAETSSHVNAAVINIDGDNDDNDDDDDDNDDDADAADSNDINMAHEHNEHASAQTQAPTPLAAFVTCIMMPSLRLRAQSKAFAEPYAECLKEYNASLQTIKVLKDACDALDVRIQKAKLDAKKNELVANLVAKLVTTNEMINDLKRKQRDDIFPRLFMFGHVHCTDLEEQHIYIHPRSVLRTLYEWVLNFKWWLQTMNLAEGMRVDLEYVGDASLYHTLRDLARRVKHMRDQIATAVKIKKEGAKRRAVNADKDNTADDDDDNDDDDDDDDDHAQLPHIDMNDYMTRSVIATLSPQEKSWFYPFEIRTKWKFTYIPTWHHVVYLKRAEGASGSDSEPTNTLTSLRANEAASAGSQDTGDDEDADDAAASIDVNKINDAKEIEALIAQLQARHDQVVGAK